MWVLHLVGGFVGHSADSIGNVTAVGRLAPANASARAWASPVESGTHPVRPVVDYGSTTQVVAVEPDGLERQSRAELVELDEGHIKGSTDAAQAALALDNPSQAGPGGKKSSTQDTGTRTAIIVTVSTVIAGMVVGVLMCVLRGGTGFETDVPTRRSKLVCHFDGQSFDPDKAAIAKKLPCPVVAMLLANNEIEGLYTYSEKGQSDRPDGEATFLLSIASVHEISMRLGADPRCARAFVVALRAAMATSSAPLAPSSARQVLPDSAVYIDLLHHAEYGCGHDHDTRIRDNPAKAPDEAAFERLLGFANVIPGYESLGTVMTLADLKEWSQAARSARQGRDGTLDGLIPFKVLLDVFGSDFGLYDNRRYIPKAALKSIYLDMKYPEGFVPYLRDHAQHADWKHGKHDSHA